MMSPLILFVISFIIFLFFFNFLNLFLFPFFFFFFFLLLLSILCRMSEEDLVRQFQGFFLEEVQKQFDAETQKREKADWNLLGALKKVLDQKVKALKKENEEVKLENEEVKKENEEVKLEKEELKQENQTLTKRLDEEGDKGSISAPTFLSFLKAKNSQQIFTS